MQDRYVGDIGDCAEPGLPRAQMEGSEFMLGAARHRVPDETGGRDGSEIDHLDRSGLRAELDREPFDSPHHLRKVAGERRAIESHPPVLSGAVPFSESMIAADGHGNRRERRKKRLARDLQNLSGRDLAFAGPDDGVADDEDERKGKKEFRKRIPLEGIYAATRENCAAIHHRDARARSGHDLEVNRRLARLGMPALAASSGLRALFVVNPVEKNSVRPKTRRAFQNLVA